MPERRARHQGGAQPHQAQPDDHAMLKIARVAENASTTVRGDNARPDAQVRNRACQKQQRKENKALPDVRITVCRQPDGTA